MKHNADSGTPHALVPRCDFTGGCPTDLTGDNRNTVELNETPGAHCYWEEIKGNGCKYYKNAVTNRYLGEYTNSLDSSVFCEKWGPFIKWSKINTTAQGRKKGLVQMETLKVIGKLNILKSFFLAKKLIFNFYVSLQGLTP